MVCKCPALIPSSSLPISPDALNPALLNPTFCAHTPQPLLHLTLFLIHHTTATLPAPSSLLQMEHNYLVIIIRIILFPHYKPICSALLPTRHKHTAIRMLKHTHAHTHAHTHVSPLSLSHYPFTVSSLEPLE